MVSLACDTRIVDTAEHCVFKASRSKMVSSQCVTLGSRNFIYMKSYYVYILASERNGTLYIGITSNLAKRIWENKNKAISGFTSKYNTDKLVYFEEFQDINLALGREKLLKSWQRKWKMDLIEQTNQEWKDLYDEIVL